VSKVVGAEHDGTDPMHTTPSFDEERELFAVKWHLAGLPVPMDYEHELAQPMSQQDREYQSVRGKGDGRRPLSTLPRSLRSEPNGFTLEEERSLLVFDTPALEGRCVNLADMNANVVVLCFIIMQTAPLILAMLNGFEVIGADLRQTTHRSIGLALATRWAERAIGATTSTFLVGEYAEGARLFAAPVNIEPPPSQVVGTPAQRVRQARAGCGLAWCTLAALAGTISYDPAARAAAACSALCGPVEYLADAAICGHPLLASFSFGAFRSCPLVDSPQGLPVSSTAPELALQQAWGEARLLSQRIHEEGTRLLDFDLLDWGHSIKPAELQDIPRELFEHLPSFDDPRLDQLAFTPIREPNRIARLQRKPVQLPVPIGRCPRSAADLMPPLIYQRVEY